MKILISEDDVISRTFMKRHLEQFGPCHIAVDGIETLDAFLSAQQSGEPFYLICLDLMMPKLDGHSVLRAIRDYEIQKELFAERRSKIIMTTALNDAETVAKCYASGCDGFVWKPIDLKVLHELFVKLEII